MASKFGVNVSIVAKASRPISIESITPIAIAGSLEGEAGLYFFTSVKKALEFCKSVEVENGKSIERIKEGSIYPLLNGISTQAVETPIILSLYENLETLQENKSEIIKALEQLKFAESKFGYRPNLIISEYSSEMAIATKMEEIAKRLKATAIIDIQATSIEAAILASKKFGSERVLLCYPSVRVFDPELNKEVDAQYSSCIAGMIARTDGESEYGWSDSFSNRTIGGILDSSIPIEFVMGEGCEADMLRSANITTIIRQQGFRTWGGETSSSDTIWKDLARVRIFDRISEACQKGVFYAIDRKASELFWAKKSVEDLLRNLKGSKVLLGYEVFWDNERNTDATVTQGKFYLNIEMQNNPIVKSLEIEFAYVDKYAGELLNELNK